MRHARLKKIAFLFAAVSFYTFHSSSASACGCFTPPNPSVSVIQAGEQILFAMSGNQVTAYVKIQYSGDAQDFGWLLPLPSVPDLDVGTDELFYQLAATTDPVYTVASQLTGNCGQQFPASDLGAAFFGDGAAGGTGIPGGPLVKQDSVGPYDYAVLKADDQSAMTAWLTANHYYVPAATSDAVLPYIHAGAYFLALRLHSGKSAGDIAPVVLNYTSDLPMIPIVLTSVGAQEDMGIAVFLLGDSRAIPRNYYHTVINDAALDWKSLGLGESYNDLVIRATKEADGRHTFVTEFAGASTIMQGVLDPPGRDMDAANLAALTDAAAFTAYLRDHGYTFSGPLITILQKYLPVPQFVLDRGSDAANYYYNMSYWLNLPFADFGDGGVAGYTTFDPKALSDEIDSTIIQPLLAAGLLFRAHPYMTRLYTTLSPAQMNRDPVFSFNPFLPDVGNRHTANETGQCSTSPDCPYGYDTTLTTEQGFSLSFACQRYGVNTSKLPASLRIEILREAGAPEPVTDNTDAIRSALTALAGSATMHPADLAMSSPDMGISTPAPESLGEQLGCSLAGGPAKPFAATLLLCACALALCVRRRD